MTSKVWQLLSNYESHALVRRDYAAKHSWTPNAEHSREICAPFSQARAYFDSASGADRSVKPLLLYYGIVGLARGLTLYLSRGTRDASLAPSHGLAVKDWNKTFAAPNADVGQLEVTVGARGTFPELLGATQNRSLLRGNSSAVNFKFKHQTVPTSAIIYFGELLGRIPEIDETFSRWRRTSHCAALSVQQVGADARITIKKRGVLDRRAADRIMVGARFENEDSTSCMYVIPNQLDALPGISDRVSDAMFGIGDLYIVERYSGGLSLPKIGAAFALSYFLGMLVRYYPSRWIGLLQSQSNDGALPTLLAALEFLEHTFPRLIADFLEETGPLVGKMP